MTKGDEKTLLEYWQKNQKESQFMKNRISWFCASLFSVMLLAACGRGNTSFNNDAKSEITASNVSIKDFGDTAENGLEVLLPQSLIDSYYEGQNTPGFEYFKKSRIQEFLAMWVKEETGDITDPVWYFDSFTRISVLDHDFTDSYPERQLYCCTFSDGGSRYGYAIVQYNQTDPSIGNWGVVETTPYIYDFNANKEEIAAGLKKTDIDLPTAKASRVYLYDREKNRADQVIRFTDEKGDRYICYFGDSSFEIEKW